MNAFDETKEEILSGCKNILQELHEVLNGDDLAKAEELSLELFKNIAFLNTIKMHSQKFVFTSEPFENQIINENLSEEQKPVEDAIPQLAVVSEEESAENQEHYIDQIIEPVIQQDEVLNDENLPVEDIVVSTESPEESETLAEKQKRFKLAQIKNLSKQQQPTLFSEEILQDAQSQAIIKSNMPLDFMEAPKPRPDFRLDLNDRIAFTQRLFGGSQTDLNDAVQALNRCTTVDEAKEYLSDLYYEKNWKKADDYAQRLWTLVENKFL